MNYLCKDVTTNILFVVTNISKDWTKYIQSKTQINIGSGNIIVIQEIELR